MLGNCAARLTGPRNDSIPARCDRADRVLDLVLARTGVRAELPRRTDLTLKRRRTLGAFDNLAGHLERSPAQFRRAAVTPPYPCTPGNWPYDRAVKAERVLWQSSPLHHTRSTQLPSLRCAAGSKSAFLATTAASDPRSIGAAIWAIAPAGVSVLEHRLASSAGQGALGGLCVRSHPTTPNKKGPPKESRSRACAARPEVLTPF
jgi:hypothetical protein